MKAASVQEIKKQLQETSPGELVELCLRLARFKKENKELLTYLLFESGDEGSYIRNVCEELDEGFAQVNQKNLYQAKKTIRKLLRHSAKYIRYSGSRTTEVEILLHFCQSMKGLNLPLHKSAALANLYTAQLKKTESAIATMHEDLQYDYLRKLKRLYL